MAHSISLRQISAHHGARQHCQIRVISLLLCKQSGEPLRLLFLDREGHVSAEPHYVPRDEALILASNQQRIWGSAARVLVL